MTDKLTPPQTLLVWCLLVRQGIAKQAEIMPAPKAADRKALEAAKLVTSKTIARSLWITLEDKGWAWAAEHLRDPLPPAQGALQGMMARLHDHLSKANESLADFIGAAPVPNIETAAPTVGQNTKRNARKGAGRGRGGRGSEEPVDVRTEIERAYLAVTNNRKGVDARLTNVRANLTHIDRAKVDAELIKMFRADAKTRLMRMDDYRSITAADDKAALTYAGEPFHVLWIFA